MELQVDRRASPEPMSKRAINRSESSARLSRLSGLSGLWVLPRLASIADAKRCTLSRGCSTVARNDDRERAPGGSTENSGQMWLCVKLTLSEK